MNTAEVVVDSVEGNPVAQVLNPFAESVGKTGEPAHSHPHSEILALGVTGRNVLRTWRGACWAFCS